MRSFATPRKGIRDLTIVVFLTSAVANRLGKSNSEMAGLVFLARPFCPYDFRSSLRFPWRHLV